MKVFISWSGELSRKCSGALKDWLEQCIQSLEVFFSSEDIEKGDNWHNKLNSELKDTNYGIVCLTSENIDAPWIHFEAGALSKMLDSRVMVLAININFSDIKGPLNSFQATKLEEDDMFKLLKSINSFQEKPLSDDKLKNSFNAFWSQFYKRIEEIKEESIIKNDDKKTSTKVNVSGTVDEILQLVRNQNSIITNPEKILPLDYLDFALKRLGFSDNTRIMEEVYAFTKYAVDQYKFFLPEDDACLEFLYNYRKMVMEICNDSGWRRRFSRLFSSIDWRNSQSTGSN